MSQDETSTDMNRRRALQLGAVGATALMTIRPSAAQAATSVLNCWIPVNPTGSQWIAADGTLVPYGTAGAFQGGYSYTGSQVKSALAGGLLPGATASQSGAYLNYIKRLQYGQAGYTCFASVQMPV